MLYEIFTQVTLRMNCITTTVIVAANLFSNFAIALPLIVHYDGKLDVGCCWCELWC